jgi:hypothetical protein
MPTRSSAISRKGFQTMHVKSLALVVCVTVLAHATSAVAQVSGGIYGGATQDERSSFMFMSDIGTRVDVEPWAQSFDRIVQLGVDVIVLPKLVGVVVGANSNSRGARIGAVLDLFGRGQARLMKHSSGQVQAVLYYNINLTKRLYLQPWLAPAGKGGSTYLLGVGYIFKE